MMTGAGGLAAPQPWKPLAAVVPTDAFPDSESLTGVVCPAHPDFSELDHRILPLGTPPDPDRDAA